MTEIKRGQIIKVLDEQNRADFDALESFVLKAQAAIEVIKSLGEGVIRTIFGVGGIGDEEFQKSLERRLGALSDNNDALVEEERKLQEEVAEASQDSHR